MKQIYLLLLLLASTIGYSQTNGISYQALILNPNPQKMPGINEANTALANQKICLQFVIQDEQKQVEYQETLSTTTDELGMVNVIIGSGSQTGGYAIDFKSVSWNAAIKTLNVGVNISGSCGAFTEISDQIFNSVPFAFSAENVTGIVAIENGGTNASNVIDAKINLNLGNVDNTSDLNKPVSTAAQTALNLKENVANKSTAIITDGASNTKYPSVKAIKDYVDDSVFASYNTISDEVDATQAGAGLANDGTYIKNTTANYIAAATDLNDADNKLDLQAKANADAIATEKTRATSAETTLQTNIDAEATAARAAELVNSDAIGTEKTRATGIEGNIQSE
ncbi:hypothetical protein, partial [Flavobacterium frigoris]